MYSTSAQKIFKGKRGAIERPNFGLSMPACVQVHRSQYVKSQMQLGLVIGCRYSCGMRTGYQTKPAGNFH